MTLEGVPVEWLGIGSGWTLFALLAWLVVRAVVRGDLVPRSTHEDALHDRDMWRANSMVSEAGRAKVEDNQRELLEPVARTMGQLFSEMQGRAWSGRGRRDSGGSQHEQEEDL